MGLYSSRRCATGRSAKAVQPDPSAFTVVSVTKIGNLYVSKINYQNATNYEGDKVMVTTFDPRSREVLDPHFSAGSGIVARFEPTPDGLENARLFCNALDEKAERGQGHPLDAVAGTSRGRHLTRQG